MYDLTFRKVSRVFFNIRLGLCRFCHIPSCHRESIERRATLHGDVSHPKLDMSQGTHLSLKRITRENIIMSLAEKGVSRQEAHEQIRVVSHQATKQIKEHGQLNDLIERIRANSFFKPIHEELEQLLDPTKFTGRSVQQVERFTGPGGEVQQALEKYGGLGKQEDSVNLNV